MSSGLFENVIYKICLQIIYIYILYIYIHTHTYLIYMYKENLALNNQQWLICHKTKQNKQDTTQSQFLSGVQLV